MDPCPEEGIHEGVQGRGGEDGHRGRTHCSEVGRRLSISKATIDYWVRTSRNGPLQDGNSLGRKEPVTDEQMELARLRQENAEPRWSVTY